MIAKTTMLIAHDLVEYGGAIVSSSECHEIEIAGARNEGRFYDSIGEMPYGFVRRTQEWLDFVKETVAEKANEH